MINKHGVGQPIGTQKPVVCARGLGGLAAVPGHGGGQHVLHQGALATAGNAGHGHQALQGELDAEAAQVV
ncbi:MAG: hypothetical protein ACKOER_14875, partial [Betaproteobacteria bacterium]